MPGQKGRKRRPRDRARRDRVPGASDEPAAEAEPTRAPARKNAGRQAPPRDGLPSTTARSTGFMLAVFTGFLAALMFYGAVGGDQSTTNVVAQIVAAAGLLMIALAVAALCLFPGAIRDRLGRGRG